jgi:hypothetical protein
VFTASGTGYNAVMATQDFAASDANPGPFLLGVVYRDSNKDGTYSVGEGLSGVTIMPMGANFYAVSSTSGGYAIPITGLTGTLNVTFSGGALTAPITKSVTLTGENVKLDFEFIADTAVKLSFAHGSAGFAAGQFQADIQGPAGVRVSIRSSPDLQTWTEIRQVTLTGSSIHLTDGAGGQTHKFYRLVQL